MNIDLTVDNLGAIAHDLACTCAESETYLAMDEFQILADIVESVWKELPEEQFDWWKEKYKLGEFTPIIIYGKKATIIRGKNEMSFCGNCGAQVDSNAAFCANCGARLISPTRDAVPMHKSVQARNNTVQQMPPVQQVQPTRQVQPVQQVQPTWQVQPVQQMQPVQQVQPVQYVQPVMPVYVQQPAANYGQEPKNKVTAFLLCLFLGFTGAHKFYEGKVGAGILYLLTVGILGIGWMIDSIVLFVRLFT